MTSSSPTRRSPPAGSTTWPWATGIPFLSGRAGETTWAYAGAPEPVAVDQDGAGDVCLVRLEDGIGGRSSVHLERVRVGRTTFRSLEFDAAELASQDDLVRRLAEQADPDLVLTVTVAGIAPDSLEIQPDEVQRILAGSFLHLRVRGPQRDRAGRWSGAAA